MHLAQGHNTVTLVRLKPAIPLSQVKHSTIEPLHSLQCLCEDLLPNNIGIKIGTIWALLWENLILVLVKNKGADQPVYLCRLISAIVIHSHLYTGKFSIFLYKSVKMSRVFELDPYTSCTILKTCFSCSKTTKEKRTTYLHFCNTPLPHGDAF